MILSRQAGVKLERFLEAEIEKFFSREGWSISTKSGDHIAFIESEDDDGEWAEITVNLTRMAQHLAEQSCA